jgi:thymidine kinase
MSDETARLPHTGSIELVIGPMFSEKTTTMISRVRRATYAGQSALIVKHARDTRYVAGPSVAAHSELRQSSDAGAPDRAPVRVVEALALAEAAEEVERGDYQVIGVDEGQFYADLVPQCEAWAAAGRRVVVAALDGDFRRAPFGAVCALVPLCESVQKMAGVCMACRARDSSFSQRIVAGDDPVMVGAKESYRAVCRACYAK